MVIPECVLLWSVCIQQPSEALIWTVSRKNGFSYKWPFVSEPQFGEEIKLHTADYPNEAEKSEH